MSAIADAAAAITAAVKAAGLRVYNPLDSVDPPAVVLGPPRLFWDRLSDAPSRAQFDVLVVAPASDRLMAQLWELVPKVAAAISDHTDGAVDTNGATPVPYAAGGTSLPSYTISISIPLGD